MIYEAALDPELWPQALQRVAELNGGILAALFFFDPVTGRVVHDLASPYRGYDLYSAEYAQMDPRTAYGPTQPAGTRVRDYDVISEAEIARSAFYQDFLLPRDMGYSGGLMLKNDRHGVAGIAVQRARRQPYFELHELDVLERLGPHLLRALRLQTRFAECQGLHWADTALQDRLPFAVVKLDASARIVELNRTAEALLAAADGLTASLGRLRAAHAADAAALDRLIDNAVRTANGSGVAGGGTIALRRPSLRRPLSATAMPIPRRQAHLEARRPAVLLIVSDLEMVPVPPADRLRSLFGLTPAEARLALAIVSGSSLQDAADAFGVTIGTVRNQLKQVLAKTDTRRQAELVRLLVTSSLVE